MKAGKYTIRELFVNNYIDQIIIPEIQRDYVWKEEQVEGLLQSIKADYDKYTSASIDVVTNDSEIKQLFESFYRKQKHSSNIGFIYAYNDETYSGKYFLIDGQQRITTIYLLLLAICVEIDKETFEKYYCTEGEPKLDYKVRDSAHQFLNKFISHTLKGEEINLDTLKSQYWYLMSFENDKTIQCLLNNYIFIREFIEQNNLKNQDFLQYVQNYIEFWYFDTNLSDQGEELYIYMNARGEQIQVNENLKAELLGRLNDQKEKNFWGKKWENWQDFFWQRKGKNENADIGFNEFINCITGLELYKRKIAGENGHHSKVNELLSLASIERYLNALIFLENELDSFCAQYDYAEWAKDYKDLIWSYLNKTIKRNANWFADFKDRNKNDDRNNMVLLWSLFYYFESNHENLKRDEFFRAMRLFYVRFHNYNRSVPTLKKSIDLFIINGVIDKIENEMGTVEADPEEETDTSYKTTEEKKKYAFLTQFIQDQDLLRQYEEAIWEIEDQKYNLDGSNLGNINIGHLVDLSTLPTLEHLKKVRDRFLLLMNYAEGTEKAELVTLLLHYGFYAQQVSPSYYLNYQFNDWRRVIRNRDGNKTAFKDFFHDFLATQEPKPLSDLLEEKNRLFIEQHQENLFSLTDLNHQLIVYSILLKGKLWSNKFFYIGRETKSECTFFDQEYTLFNSERYYGSKGTWYLWQEVKKQYGEDREKIKSILLNTIQKTIHDE